MGAEGGGVTFEKQHFAAKCPPKHPARTQREWHLPSDQLLVKPAANGKNAHLMLPACTPPSNSPQAMTPTMFSKTSQAAFWEVSIHNKDPGLLRLSPRRAYATAELPLTGSADVEMTLIG